MRAKLFRNGRSQAVRLPAEFRFEGTEVEVHRDPDSGAVVLTPVRPSARELLALRDALLQEPGFREEATLDLLLIFRPIIEPYLRHKSSTLDKYGTRKQLSKLT